LFNEGNLLSAECGNVADFQFLAEGLENRGIRFLEFRSDFLDFLVELIDSLLLYLSFQ
jgi:hypothetical protein